MQKRPAAFTVIETLLVTTVTSFLGVLSVSTLAASEPARYPAELVAQTQEKRQQTLGQCQMLKLMPDCHRYVSARSYKGPSTSHTRLALSVIPNEHSTFFSNSSFRVFSSEDTRGSDYELRTNVGDEYDFVYTGGGGVITLKAKDFIPGKAQNLWIDLKQSGAEIEVQIWLDKALKFERSVVGQLDHGNQYTVLGEWDNNHKLETFYGQVALLGVWID